MAKILEKYLGTAPIKCEVPKCREAGAYLFGGEGGSVSEKLILCEGCVKIIVKGAVADKQKAT